MVIGLTGSFGTGKSTVAKMFKSLGAHVIDADKIVHRLIDTATRKKLAKVVFDDPKALKELCRAIHPKVKDAIGRDIQENLQASCIIIDAPLLIEAGMHKKCDCLVVVSTDQKTQIGRLAKKYGMPRPESLKRIHAQMALKKKMALANYCIDNNASLQHTRAQVRDVWKVLVMRNAPRQIKRGVQAGKLSPVCCKHLR